MTPPYVTPPSAAQPYVAERQGPSLAEGSTVLTDVASLYDAAVRDHDALAAVFDAGGFALDVLGDIGDPLQAALGCAVGWIVDHIGFLREPVDWLAGDPDSIAASIRTWGDVSTGMHADARDLEAALAGLDAATWSGDAADAYRRRAAQWVGALDSSGGMAELESVLIAATGGLCAAVRGLIFDTIAAALERWLLLGLAALANSAWTFGASLAAWVIDVEIDAGLLAARIGAKIADLVGKAGRVAETLARDGSRFEHAAQTLSRHGQEMMHDVRSARSLLGWDRRYARGWAAGDVAHVDEQVAHLTNSLDTAHALMHVGVAGTVVKDGGDAAAAATDSDPEHVSRLAGDAARDAAGAAAHRAQRATGGH